MTENNTYDLIVVGSGNGACGFLSYYLDNAAERSPCEKILVLEEGEHFFKTSDIAHQLNWLKSFAEGSIFKLHNALTPKGTPIISGRACTMGGGGSINYTMIHESSEWLTTHMGHSIKYWDQLKMDLNQRFQRSDPATDLSPITQYILQIAEEEGFQQITDACNYIPNHPEKEANLLHLFPTLFNLFGQRTHSGVSIVDWDDPRITLKTCCRAEQLEFSADNTRCIAVHAHDRGQDQRQSFHLAETGRLVLCTGAATPRLLLPYRQTLQNQEIGRHVSDHILLPLGLYVANQDTTPRDNYIPIFATSIWQSQGQTTVCTFDFFAGEFQRLLFLVSHLFLALLLPNWLKKQVIRVPWLFTITKTAVRWSIQVVNFIIDIVWGLTNLLSGQPWHSEVELVTAILKFKPAADGYYSEDGSQITLDFFRDDQGFNQDQAVAKQMITQHLKLINRLGDQPHPLVKYLLRLFTKIPYREDQVDQYVETYAKKFLLTEQHLAGGCLFDQVLDLGVKDAAATGKVIGSANVHVADLSAVPLPRVSPQMTAYLIGFHVAKQLCCETPYPI